MKEKKIYMWKRILFTVVLVFLLLPLIQQNLNIVHVKELHKVSNDEVKPIFSLKKYFDGTFQQKKEKYFNENFGFRDFCVRLNNQIAYSLFKEARANDVIVGKEDYLFEEKYIRTYLGRDFIGEKAIREKVRKLKMVQDTLAKKNIELFVVLAPGKGMFYPEYIPDLYFKEEPTISNYQQYVREFKESGINFVDFNKWFIEMKDTTSYPLFPKAGIHWSRYGEVLVADSISNYIASLGNLNMPEIVKGKIELTNELKGEDNDIEKGMNLLFKVPNFKMAYPSFKIIRDENLNYPKVLTIGDSFYYDMYRLGFSDELFNNGEFWYYNKKIYHNNPNTPKSVAEINVPNEIEKNNAIMIMVTDANLGGFAFGFIDNLYDYYFKR